MDDDTKNSTGMCILLFPIVILIIGVFNKIQSSEAWLPRRVGVNHYIFVVELLVTGQCPGNIHLVNVHSVCVII